MLWTREESLDPAMHQITIPQSSSPQPRQCSDYAIPAARLDSGLNITLHFLFDKLRAVIPVPYCNSEAQGRIIWTRCEATAIFRSPGDKPTEQRNLRECARLPAVTLRNGDTQWMAGFHYVYTLRIRAATPPNICTSARRSYLSTVSILHGVESFFRS